MFGKEQPSKEVETIIGPSVRLEGNFSSEGNVRVAGSLSGTLQTKGNLWIDEGANVIANMAALNVFIAGTVKGEVKASENLDIASTARIQGNIETKTLTVAPGAHINGKCTTKDGSRVERVEKENKS